MTRVLILAGTTEATELAHRFAGNIARPGDGIEVISSLAGVTRAPVHRPGEVRSGGFGGTDGLARYLADRAVDVLIDATHPFAAVMPFHAAAAASHVGIAHCRLLRPAWEPIDGDHWVDAADASAAATEVARLGAQRVFLTVGRGAAPHFSNSRHITFVARAIEPLGDVLPEAEVVLQRGPFAVEDEIELLTDRRIDVMVAKNSGGDATSAKLTAARRLGVPVVMIARPPQPDAMVVTSVDDTLRWFEAILASVPPRAETATGAKSAVLPPIGSVTP